MNPRRLLFLVVLALVALPACGRYSTSYAAIVEGETISFADLDKQVKSLAASQGIERVTDDVRARLRRDAVLTLIQRALVRTEIAKANLDVPEAQVRARFEDIRKRFPDPQQFSQALKSQGFTEETLLQGIREQLGFELLGRKVAPVRITEQQLQKAYQDNKADYEQVHARHILFSTESQTPAQALSKAQDAVRRIRAGADFAAIAKQLSDDTGSKEAGGDLGLRSRSYFDADFSRAAFTLPLKRVSDPVRTRFGYHVVEVLERTVRTFAQVRAELQAQLVQDAQQEGLNAYLRKVIGSAHIEVNPLVGDFDLQRLQVVEHRFFSPAPAEGTPTPILGIPASQ